MALMLRLHNIQCLNAAMQKMQYRRDLRDNERVSSSSFHDGYMLAYDKPVVFGGYSLPMGEMPRLCCVLLAMVLCDVT
ncbi:MAG: hypothetical protein ACK5LJ_11820 [Paracoccus sp. (in: a-proteobacteria)]